MEGKLSQCQRTCSFSPSAPGQPVRGKCADWVTGPGSSPTPADAGFLDDAVYDSTALGPGYDRPFQFDPSVREPKSIQLYKHLNLKSCVWTFDAYYDMTELIDVCGGSVTADFQVGAPGPALRLQAAGAKWDLVCSWTTAVSTLHLAAPQSGADQRTHLYKSPHRELSSIMATEYPLKSSQSINWKINMEKFLFGIVTYIKISFLLLYIYMLLSSGDIVTFDCRVITK